MYKFLVLFAFVSLTVFSFLYQFIYIVTSQGRYFDIVVHAELSECLVDDLVSDELLVGLGSVQVAAFYRAPFQSS